MEVMNFDFLKDVLPPVVWRANWNNLKSQFGLPFSRGTMQNLDSRGTGPKRFSFGESKRIAYKREDLIQWLNERLPNDEAV